MGLECGAKSMVSRWSKITKGKKERTCREIYWFLISFPWAKANGLKLLVK